jgi:hypothetical protein
MIFHQNLLQKGVQGGEVAANAINNAVLDWARTNIPETRDDAKVVVRVYANVRSIGDACVKAGIISHPSQLEDFVLGFNSAHPLFDFIDVGTAKDAADGKVVGEYNRLLEVCTFKTDSLQDRSSSFFTTITAATYSSEAATTSSMPACCSHTCMIARLRAASLS